MTDRGRQIDGKKRTNGQGSRSIGRPERKREMYKNDEKRGRTRKE
jgi:hypothetical protein